MSRTGTNLIDGLSLFMGDALIDLRYAAGFFDGEGTVLIQRKNPVGAMKSPKHMLQCAITNTYHPVLESFCARWGGGVYKRTMPEGLKPQWQWEIRNAGAAAFLADISPYLFEKHDAAWLGQEFQAQRSRTVAMKNGILPEELALREGFRLAIQGTRAHG